MITEGKLKHLEFIQTVVSRLNNNSFLLKGWSITIASAVFVLTDKQAEKVLFLVPFFSIPSFWLMDGYYLALERKFRDLYEKVRTEERDADFSMKIEPLSFGDFAGAATSWTSLFFHGVLIAISIFLLIKEG